MNRSFYKMATWLMWLALPTTALNYWRNWDRLPARMAAHFDANWQPNGYTSREGSLMLALGIIAFLLVIFTVGAHAVRVNKPTAAWPVLISLYLALGFFCFANNWIVQRNLQHDLQGSARSPRVVVLHSEFPPRQSELRRS